MAVPTVRAVSSKQMAPAKLTATRLTLVEITSQLVSNV